RRVGGPARAEAVRPAGALERAGERRSEGCRRQRVPVRRQGVGRRALLAGGAPTEDEGAGGGVRAERARGPDRDEAPDAEGDEPLEDDRGRASASHKRSSIVRILATGSSGSSSAIARVTAFA